MASSSSSAPPSTTFSFDSSIADIHGAAYGDHSQFRRGRLCVDTKVHWISHGGTLMIVDPKTAAKQGHQIAGSSSSSSSMAAMTCGTATFSGLIHQDTQLPHGYGTLTITTPLGGGSGGAATSSTSATTTTTTTTKELGKVFSQLLGQPHHHSSSGGVDFPTGFCVKCCDHSSNTSSSSPYTVKKTVVLSVAKWINGVAHGKGMERTIVFLSLNNDNSSQQEGLSSPTQLSREASVVVALTTLREGQWKDGHMSGEVILSNISNGAVSEEFYDAETGKCVRRVNIVPSTMSVAMKVWESISWFFLQVPPCSAGKHNKGQKRTEKKMAHHSSRGDESPSAPPREHGGPHHHHGAPERGHSEEEGECEREEEVASDYGSSDDDDGDRRRRKPGVPRLAAKKKRVPPLLQLKKNKAGIMLDRDVLRQQPQQQQYADPFASHQQLQQFGSANLMTTPGGRRAISAAAAATPTTAGSSGGRRTPTMATAVSGRSSSSSRCSASSRRNTPKGNVGIYGSARGSPYLSSRTPSGGAAHRTVSSLRSPYEAAAPSEIRRSLQQQSPSYSHAPDHHQQRQLSHSAQDVSVSSSTHYGSTGRSLAHSPSTRHPAPTSSGAASSSSSPSMPPPNVSDLASLVLQHQKDQRGASNYRHGAATPTYKHHDDDDGDDLVVLSSVVGTTTSGGTSHHQTADHGGSRARSAMMTRGSTTPLSSSRHPLQEEGVDSSRRPPSGRPPRSPTPPPPATALFPEHYGACDAAATSPLPAEYGSRAGSCKRRVMMNALPREAGASQGDDDGIGDNDDDEDGSSKYEEDSPAPSTTPFMETLKPSSSSVPVPPAASTFDTTTCSGPTPPSPPPAARHQRMVPVAAAAAATTSSPGGWVDNPHQQLLHHQRSPTTPTPPPALPFRLGQHVIAMLGRGDVYGVVMYCGPKKHRNSSSGKHYVSATMDHDGSDVVVGIVADDRGAGKHSGTVAGVEYFSCEDKRGILVPASVVMASHARKPFAY